MAKDELIDSQVSLKQCRLAVEALHSHESKKLEKLQETELLPGKEQNIWLNLTVKKIPSGHKFKPVKIPIVHPLVDPRTTPVCLITKDPQRQYKDLLESHNIKFISRVVGMEKLKGKFKPFEARRALLKENGLFLADERVIPMLPKLLGTKWFEAKKQPIPVCLTRKDLKGELERAISSTYMNQNQGTCTSIKVSTLSHKPAQVLANIQTALPAIVKHIKGGWDNVQSFHIKTNSSVSLPIWTCRLDGEEGGRWDGFTLKDEESEGEEESDEEDEMEVDEDTTRTKKGTKKTGLKRMSSSDEEEESEKPRKKSKGVKGVPVDVPPPTKEKSTSKSAAPTTISAPPPAKATKVAAADVDTPIKSKKRKAAATPSTPAAKDAESHITTADSSSVKKVKKTKSIAVSAAEPQPSVEAPVKIAPTSEPISVSGEKKKKKKVTVAIDDEPSLSSTELAPKKRKAKKPDTSLEVPPVPSVPIASEEKPIKEKKKAKSDQADAAAAKSPEKAAVSSVTKEEHKQKRSGGAGEKKKEKVARSKGGKSAKDNLLGKKPGQGL